MKDRLYRISALLPLAFLVLLGCDGGAGLSPVAPRVPVVFAPDQPPGANSISLRDAGSTASTLRLELFANEVNNVASVAFTMSYPSDLLTYNGASQGDFLGGLAVLLATQLPINAVLVVDAGPFAASGSGVILEMEFSAQESGQGTLELLSPQAQDSLGNPLSDVQWIDGTVSINL